MRVHFSGWVRVDMTLDPTDFEGLDPADIEEALREMLQDENDVVNWDPEDIASTADAISRVLKAQR